ncbi:MAG: phosphatidylserine decarboxylase, partial [Campylobacter sp.]|nr:phosphatidylserine decarboxylase [Campylobacter sp.]
TTNRIKKRAKMTGYITKFGYKYIAIFGVLLLLSLLLGFLPLLFTAIFIFVIYFFRDPERVPYTDDELALLSPIDGKIIDISLSNFEGDEATKIIIEKSFFGVGSLRSPCDMQICDFRRRHGLFLCNRMKISEALNERVLFICKNGSLKFAMRIICGVFSRRLFIDRAQNLKASRKFGFLTSGMIIMFLPKDTKICVSTGDKLKAGELLGYFDTKDRR